MAESNKIIYLYQTFNDAFGGSVTFQNITVMCAYNQGVIQIKVTSPWGQTDTAYVEWDQPFIKTYLNGNQSYSVNHRLFCGTEITALDCHTTLITLPTTGNISCRSYDAAGVEMTGAMIVKDNVNTGQVTPYTFTNLPAGTYNISFQKTGYSGCSTTVTVIVSATVTAECNLIPVPTTGSLSITSTPTGAAIYLDSLPTGKLTGAVPVILSDLGPGIHTVVFVKDGYVNCTQQQDVIVGTTRTVHCDLALPAPGFDIIVDIPGLLPESKLQVFEVINVPLSSSWYYPPFAPYITWNNISNGVFKARTSPTQCDPAPSAFANFRIGKDYAVFVGTSSIAFFPDGLVHKTIEAVVEIDITSSYVDWVSTSVCSAFDISPIACSNFIFTSVNDAAFLLEMWSIITKHENLAGETVLPTWLDYALIPIAILGIFSPGISEGAVAQIVGKRLTALIKISKTGPWEVKDVLQDHTIDKFIMRASETQFDDFVRFMEAGNDLSARAILDLVELAPLSVNEIHALQRGSRLIESVDTSLVKAGSLEKVNVVLAKFADKYKMIALRAMDWAKNNPKVAITIGILAIWFMIDNLPFYIYMYLKAKGADPSARSWQGKTYIDTIDGYKFNTIEAQKLADWDLFCTNLQLWINEVDAFESFITEYESVLTNEQTFELYQSAISVYREGILLKKEVYTCTPVALPEIFTAQVTDVTDGDTVKINYDGTEYNVRFLGVNTPEGSGENYLVRRLLCPTCDEERWLTNKALYDEIKEWANLNLWHKDLTFKTDLARQYDDYGRVLAVPFEGTVNLCVKELELGYAAVYFYDINNKVNITEFSSAELIAKNASIGIWGLFETGSIRCISYPTASQVWLDDVYTGHTTVNNMYILGSVPAGLHKIEFKKIINDIPSSCNKTVIVEPDMEVTAECTLTGEVIPPPPPPPPPSDEEATWIIGESKDSMGNVLSAAKVFIDDVYLGHYTPETITFCTDCLCDAVVACGLGTHTVKVTKTGYVDWTKTRTLVSGDNFTDYPLLDLISTTFPIEISSVPTGAIIKVDGGITISSINLNQIITGEPNLIQKILDGYTPIDQMDKLSDTTIFVRKLGGLK